MAEEKNVKKNKEVKDKKVSKETEVKVDDNKKGEDKEKKARGKNDTEVKNKAGDKEGTKKGELKKSPEEKSPSKPKKNKNIRRQVQKGKAFIKSSYNNTTITFTDLHGNVLAWSSAGLLGFKGAKKATTYAAAQVAGDIHNKVQKYGLRDIEAFIKGVGSGRDAALRALVQKGYNFISIKDITPLPHNGCRPRKPRRV